MRMSVGDLFERMHDGRLYREAYNSGQSLSAFLEDEDPTEDGLDAFSRMMRVAGIIQNPDYESGRWASPYEAFEKDPNARAMVPEWAARVARRVKYGGQRAIYTSDQFPPGSVMRPYVDAAQARYFQLQPAIPISEVIAITSPIEGQDYRAFYLTDAADQETLVRVPEGTDLPTAKLTGGDHTIRLKKYGRAIELTYEEMRRRRIDLVALHLARIALRTEINKLAAILDIMLNGDGNANTAATNYNLTALDTGATAGTLTLKAWLAFKLKFVNPYSITHAIVQDDVYLQLELLNAGSANIPLAFLPGSTFGSFAPINPGLADNVRVGHTTAAPTLKIIGFDRQWAVERVVEIGSEISEVDKWIKRQTQVITLSEVEGYDIFDQFAVKTLNVNA
jgi:hypothetical protein